jgi:hypothetical protein
MLSKSCSGTANTTEAQTHECWLRLAIDQCTESLTTGAGDTSQQKIQPQAVFRFYYNSQYGFREEEYNAHTSKPRSAPNCVPANLPIGPMYHT